MEEKTIQQAFSINHQKGYTRKVFGCRREGAKAALKKEDQIQLAGKEFFIGRRSQGRRLIQLTGEGKVKCRLASLSIQFALLSHCLLLPR